jgi:hypothetical protein
MPCKRVEMIYQMGNPPITEVIRHLKNIKKKYGNIPVGSFNAGGVHIEVNSSDKDPKYLCIFRRRVKIEPGAYRVETIPNPKALYVHFW